MGFFKNPLKIDKKVASALGKASKPSAITGAVRKSFKPGLGKFQGSGAKPAPSTSKPMGAMSQPAQAATPATGRGRAGLGEGLGRASNRFATQEPRMSEGGKVKGKKK